VRLLSRGCIWRITLEVEFGNGIHFCIGAALARAEAHIAINSLLARYPDLQLGSDGLEWKSIVVFRGLKSLPVHV